MVGFNGYVNVPVCDLVQPIETICCNRHSVPTRSRGVNRANLVNLVHMPVEVRVTTMPAKHTSSVDMRVTHQNSYAWLSQCKPQICGLTSWSTYRYRPLSFSTN